MTQNEQLLQLENVQLRSKLEHATEAARRSAAESTSLGERAELQSQKLALAQRLGEQAASKLEAQRQQQQLLVAGLHEQAGRRGLELEALGAKNALLVQEAEAAQLHLREASSDASV